MAERVALGKRRRQQLGLETAEDMQSAPAVSATPLSSAVGPVAKGSASGVSAGAGAGHLGAEGLPPGVGGMGGAAAGMMTKWGYTPGKVSSDCA